MCCLFKQKTAYEMRISDWSSDVCSSDLSGFQQRSWSTHHQVTRDYGWTMGFAVGSTHRPACNQASRSDGFRFALPILRGGAGGERGHRRERLAFEELQERAAAGGDVRDVVGDAVLVDRCQGVAATGDGEGLRLGDGVCQGFGALAEGVELEHADWAVPDHG